MENVKDILKDFPGVSDKDILAMHKDLAKKYVFYRKKGNNAKCYCTSCMKLFDTDNKGSIIHKSEGYCPNCGMAVTFYSEGIGREILFECIPVCRWIKKSKNVVYAVCGELRNGFQEGYRGSKPIRLEEFNRRYGSSEFALMYIVRYEKNKPPKKFEHHYYHGWIESTSEREPYYQVRFFSSCASKPFIRSNYEVLGKTFLSHYKDVYSGDNPIMYMMLCCKYPTVEFLARFGGSKIIDEIINRKSYKRVLNLMGKTPAEVFKTDGNIAAEIKKEMQAGRISLDTLKIINELKKCRHKHLVSEAMLFEPLMHPSYYKDYYKILKSTGLSVVQLINYFEKQTNLMNRQIQTDRMTYPVTGYRDYIDECIKLEYDVRDSMINRPRDLAEAHERTSSAYRAILAQQEIKKSENLYEYNRKMYEYSADGFCIVVPRTSADIIKEGKNQCHCVAGYAERHMAGKLAILFLRSTVDRDKALYTIEMHDKECIQIQGYKNHTPLTPEAKKFFNEWKKWVKLPESKKHPKSKNKGENIDGNSDNEHGGQVRA